MFVLCALGGNQIYEALMLHGDTTLKPWMWWQFLSYGFVHSMGSGVHLVLNLLMLWFFGKEVEAIYGRRAFLTLYFTALIAGGIIWAVRLLWMVGADADLLSRYALLGASGAVTAVTILFCLKLPNRTILLAFVLPVPAWVLGIMMVIGDLLGGWAGRGGDEPAVAYDVHLTGAVLGFLFFRYGHLLGGLRPTPRPSRNRASTAASWFGWLKPKPKLKIHTPDSYEDDVESELTYEELDRRGDEVLQKWHRDGEDSLTDEERRILEAYSRRMQQKHR